MSTFVDTSAFLIVLDKADPDHAGAVQIWNQLLEQDEVLISTNYVVVETVSLLQRRFGVAMVRDFESRIVPILLIEWIDQKTHADALFAVFAANRRSLSLVDCVSFAVMRRRAISTVFAFDGHFEEQGFTCLR